MSQWNGWLSVGDIAKSARCSRNLDFLLNMYSVEKEVDESTKSPGDFEYKVPNDKQLFGKIAEDIIQFIMTGDTSNEITSRGKRSCPGYH